MPFDPRQDTTFHIPVPSQEEKSNLYETVASIVNLLNGRISLGFGENQALTGNVVGVTIDVITPSVADTDFTIYHNLGFVPEHMIIVKADKAAIIYVSPTKYGDNNTLTLRSNVASATLKIWVF